MRNFKRILALTLSVLLVALSVPFTTVAAELSIDVDWNDNVGNNMEGLGAAYAFNKAAGLMQTAESNPEVAKHLVELIYDSTNGGGQTAVRVIVGDGGVRSTGTAARPGYNPINGLRANPETPGYDVEGNKIPMSTRVFTNSSAARDDNGSLTDPSNNVFLADPDNYGFATNGTALYGAYGYQMNDWGNRHYDGGSDTIWPNEGARNDDGSLASGYGFVWELPQWNEPVPGDTGGFVSDFVGKGEIKVVDRPRTLKELFDVDQIWIMKQAMAYGVDTFYACAWTAPYWMKTNMSIFGQDQGSADYLRVERDANDKKVYYQAYADYLAALVYGYWTEYGVPITHVGPYNECEATHGYSGMRVRNGADLIEQVNDYILPTMKKMFGEGGKYAGALSPEGKPLNWMPEIVIGDGTNLGATTGTSYTGGFITNEDNYGEATISTHFYGTVTLNVNERTFRNNPGASPLTPSSSALQALQNYSFWQTEYCMGDGTSHAGGYSMRWYHNSIDDAVRWAYLMTNCFNSDPGFNAFFFWWNVANNGANGSDLIRWQTTGSPQASGGSTITGAYHVYKRFYAFSHLSRFVNNGDLHIRSTTNLSAYLNSLAYRPQDGSDFSVTLTNADYIANTVTLNLKNFDEYSEDLKSVTIFRTTDSENMKKVGTVPVTKTADGYTAVIEMPAQSIISIVPTGGEYSTYNGLDGERDLYSTMETTGNDGVMGNPVEATGANGYPAMTMQNGDTLIYKNVNFADGSANGGIVRRHLLYMMANVENAQNGGFIRAYVAEPGTAITDPATQATYVGEILIPAGTSSPRIAGVTSGQTTGTRSSRIDTGDLGAYMLKDLYLVAYGVKDTDLFTISRFRFDPDDNGTSTNVTPSAGNLSSNVRPAVVGILNNGDFEDPTRNGDVDNRTVANWTAVNAASWSATDAQNYSGLGSSLQSYKAYSGMLSERSENSGITQDLTGKLTVGELYTFRGMFMPTVNDATAKAELIYKDAEGNVIGTETIAERSDIDLLPERESGARPKDTTYSGNPVNIPIAGIPLNMNSVHPVKFSPPAWHEVIGTFTYNPPAGTDTVTLMLSDDQTSTLYFDELTLAATPDRIAFLNTLENRFTPGTEAYAAALAALTSSNLSKEVITDSIDALESEVAESDPAALLRVDVTSSDGNEFEFFGRIESISGKATVNNVEYDVTLSPDGYTLIIEGYERTDSSEIAKISGVKLAAFPDFTFSFAIGS